MAVISCLCDLTLLYDTKLNIAVGPATCTRTYYMDLRDDVKRLWREQLACKRSLCRLLQHTNVIETAEKRRSAYATVAAASSQGKPEVNGAQMPLLDSGYFAVPP